MVKEEPIVLVEIKIADNCYNYGTGFLVADNLLLTARHVLPDGNLENKLANVWWLDTNQSELTQIEWADKDLDACILKCSRRLDQPISFGKFDRSQNIKYTSLGFPGAAVVNVSEGQRRVDASAYGTLGTGGSVRDSYEIGVNYAPFVHVRL